MRITHVLADGSVKADITGHVVKVQEAKDFYEKLGTINRRILTNESKEKNLWSSIIEN